MGGEALLGPRSPSDALAFHESLHLVATHVHRASLCGLGEFAASIDGVVLLPELFEGGTEFAVADLACGGCSGLLVVIGAGGNLQLFAD